MTLIEQKNATGHLAARTKRKLFLVKPAPKADLAGSSGVDDLSLNSDVLSVIEVPMPRAPVVESPIPVITSGHNAGNQLVQIVKKSAQA